MDDTTILGATLGQLGQTVKQTAKQAVKLPGEMAEDLGRQIGSAPQRPGSEGQAKPTEGKPEENKTQKEWSSNEERVKFLRGLYGSSQESKKPSEFQEQIADKSPEEQKKLTELRNKLHKENYYDPTFNPPKKQEERPVEKIEKEKKMEELELEKKEKNKPPPLAVVREQNKAEMFRGASG